MVFIFTCAGLQIFTIIVLNENYSQTCTIVFLVLLSYLTNATRTHLNSSASMYIPSEPPSSDILRHRKFSNSPIHRDAAQMQYARRRKVHIQAVVHIAHERAKHPAAGQLDAGIERHCAQRDQHIGHRQWHNEVVGNHSQFPVALHRNNDERIAKHSANDNRTEDQALQAQRQHIGPQQRHLWHGQCSGGCRYQQWQQRWRRHRRRCCWWRLVEIFTARTIEISAGPQIRDVVSTATAAAREIRRCVLAQTFAQLQQQQHCTLSETARVNRLARLCVVWVGNDVVVMMFRNAVRPSCSR